MNIRFGEEKDAKDLAELAMIIIRQMELPVTEQLGEKIILETLEEAIKVKDYRYYYKNALVAVVDGRVAGAAFGYPNESEPGIDEAFADLLEVKAGIRHTLFTDSEVDGDEWYLDTIAVFPEFRGHKIGTALLDALPRLAEKFGKNVIGLNVDFANPRAEKLYLANGFEKTGEMMISGHNYVHMKKKI
jgi:GNAT superfamily N-acetyltransferase